MSATQTITYAGFNIISLPTELQYKSDLVELENILEKHQNWTDPLSQKLAKWGKKLLTNETAVAVAHDVNILTNPEVKLEVSKFLRKLMRDILENPRLPDTTLCDPVLVGNRVWEAVDFQLRGNPAEAQEVKPHGFGRAMIVWFRSLSWIQSTSPVAQSAHSSPTNNNGPAPSAFAMSILGPGNTGIYLPSPTINPILAKVFQASLADANLKLQAAFNKIDKGQEDIRKLTEETDRKTAEFPREVERKVNEAKAEDEERIKNIEEQHQKKDRLLEEEIERHKQDKEKAMQTLQKSLEEQARLNNRVTNLEKRYKKTAGELEKAKKKSKKSGKCSVM